MKKSKSYDYFNFSDSDIIDKENEEETKDPFSIYSSEEEYETCKLCGRKILENEWLSIQYNKNFKFYFCSFEHMWNSTKKTFRTFKSGLKKPISY